jgi:tetratricopeptide (TPR) repeat protein
MRREAEHGMMNCGRRWREGRVIGLVITIGVVLVGCAETRSQIQTEFREGRIAQQNYDAGKGKYRARDYAGAVPLFQRTLSLDPKYDDAEIYLGWSFYHLGQYPDATRHFRQVVARQPRWEGAWNGLGWSQYRAGQYQVALQAFQEAVSLDPAYRDVGVGLAYALFELGRYREALPHLHRLTREGAYLYFPEPNSDVEEVRSRYAWCLYYTGGYQQARDEFAKGIQAHPKWAGLHSGLGWTYLKLGDRAKARESFQQALRLDPEYADARKGLAEANR